MTEKIGSGALDEGIALAGAVMDFVGAGVTVTGTADKLTVSIPGDLNHAILSATHTGTLAAAVVRGDLMVGNATPAWARVAVGAANSVLWTDGTDPSWSAAPRLANIADTGGTNRITTATASPHVTMNDVKVDRLGVNTAPLTNNAIEIGWGISPAAGTNATVINTGTSLITGAGNSQTIRGVQGSPSYKPASGSTGHVVEALNFLVSVSTGGAGTVVSNIRGIFIRVGASLFTGTVTNMYGIFAESPNISGTPSITTNVGLQINNMGNNANIVDAYGLRIADMTVNTGVKRLLEIGTTVPTTTSGLFRMVGNFSAAANQTPLYVSEGATPTLRQFRTFDPGAAGANFTAGQLVVVLV